METPTRLQLWYAAQCNGDWEHQYGVHIETLDNPGWRVKIDLTDTLLEEEQFEEVTEGVGAGNHPAQSPWLRCWVQERVWQGAGDESQLNRMLGLFLDWADTFS